MKVRLYVIFALVFAAASAAQPADMDSLKTKSSPLITVIAKKCIQSPCGPLLLSSDTCRHGSFRVPANGTYVLDVWTECSDTSNCSLCEACAMITRGKDLKHITFCDTGGECGRRLCKHSCRVKLLGRTSYTLTVCKLPCPDYAIHGCADCSEACEAKAALHTK